MRGVVMLHPFQYLLCGVHSAIFILLAIALRGSAGKPNEVRLPVFRSSYGQKAATNLSSFRNNLYSELLAHTMKFYDDEARWQWYLPFAPIVSCPPGCPLTTYGDGDGVKKLCATPDLQLETCVVYSLGSNNDYSFERDILDRTRCSVHTFDCTITGRSIQPLRHFFHPVCIGVGESGKYRSLTDIRQHLNHTSLNVLKADIEGYETLLLAEFATSNLPRQISMELHVAAKPWKERRAAFGGVDHTAEFGLMYFHLANLGFASFAKYDVAGNVNGAEVSWLRVERVAVQDRTG